VLAAALQAPDRVTRLALYDAFVYEAQLNLFFHLRGSTASVSSCSASSTRSAPEKSSPSPFTISVSSQSRWFEAVEQALERPGTTAAALAAVRGQRYTEMEQRYRTVTAPTLLIWGREDRVTPLAIE